MLNQYDPIRADFILREKTALFPFLPPIAPP
jgi:hypothetical protein